MRDDHGWQSRPADGEREKTTDMKLIRCLIVDDEPLACDSLRALLETMPGIEIAGEAHRVDEAVAAVGRLQPDIIFLDIQMPGGGGFEILRRLESPPAVIFVTAYDQYAIRAFDVNAVDYLLKPVLPERLEEALARVMGKPVQRRKKAVTQTRTLNGADLVLLENGQSGHFRHVRDVLCIQADGKYTEVFCTEGGHYLVRRSLSDWRLVLPVDLFARLDRGLLINRAHIRGADYTGRDATLMLGPEQHSVKLGRTAARNLRPLLTDVQ